MTGHEWERVPGIPGADEWRCARCGFVTASVMRPERDGPAGVLWVYRSGGDPVESPDVNCDEAVVRGVMES